MVVSKPTSTQKRVYVKAQDRDPWDRLPELARTTGKSMSSLVAEALRDLHLKYYLQHREHLKGKGYHGD